jgi:DNA-binding IclR family transcriptional regulator
MAQVGTVEKAVELLFHLHSNSQAQGVTAIGQALGIPKSSIHRLLVSLGRRQLVERDDRGRYRLGSGLIALGQGVLDREPVVAAARPILEAEVGEVGETFFLVGARAGALVVLDKAEGTGFVRAAPRVGSRVPVYATAVGKLYLAFDDEQFPLPREPMPSFTPQTIALPEALAAEVAIARSRGWAANFDEWIPGLSVLAAPVWLGDQMLAAVALAAASQRLQALGIESLAERVMNAGRRIEARLDGRGD